MLLFHQPSEVLITLNENSFFGWHEIIATYVNNAREELFKGGLLTDI